MNDMQPNCRRPRGGVILVLCAIVGAGIVGAQPAAETAREKADRDLLAIRNHIRSAQSKLDNGIVGLGSYDPNEPPTPARLCCSGNIDQIETSLTSLGAVLGEWSECYEREGDPTGVAAVAFLENDLRNFAAIVRGFEEARERNRTMGALRVLARSFHALNETVGELVACPPRPADDAGRKKDKKEETRKAKRTSKSEDEID